MKNKTINKILNATMIFIALCFVCVLMLTCSGCKLLREVNKTKKDSTTTQETKEGSIRKDSSGIKTDKTNTKETVYYPQPIYVQGKDGETKVVFVPQSTKETGSEKTEQAQVITDTSWKEAFNQLTVLIAGKQTTTNARVGPSTFEIIILVVLGIVVLKLFGPPIIKFITK